MRVYVVKTGLQPATGASAEYLVGAVVSLVHDLDHVLGLLQDLKLVILQGTGQLLEGLR